MADTGIEQIDKLSHGEADAKPVDGASSSDTIGSIQDLLRGHGAAGMPNLASARYGLPKQGTQAFDTRTLRAIHEFQKKHGLQVRDAVDAEMLRKLVVTPAKIPLATRPYLTLVLNKDWTPLTKVLSVVSIVEGGGRFDAVCANRDKAGLSVGIIQWAQKPGRLSELLEAWNTAAPAELSRIFGGDASLKAVRDQAKLGKEALNANGTSKNPNLEFTKLQFLNAFREALGSSRLQAVQVDTAAASFRAIGLELAKFAAVITTAKGIAFMLDLANQHGPGGAKKIYLKAVKTTMNEKEAMETMTGESVDRLAAQFPPRPPLLESVFTRGGRERREFYLKTEIFGTDPVPPPPN
jgi:hypothetical protein